MFNVAGTGGDWWADDATTVRRTTVGERGDKWQGAEGTFQNELADDVACAWVGGALRCGRARAWVISPGQGISSGPTGTGPSSLNTQPRAAILAGAPGSAHAAGRRRS